MNLTPDEELQRIQAMLSDIRLAEPPSRLDRRLDGLMNGRFRKFVGPAWGFAAGVLLTIGIWPFLPGGAGPAKVAPMPVSVSRISPAPTKQSAATPAVEIWARPASTVDEIHGQVHGMPVRLERTRYGFVVQETRGDQRILVELPESVRVRQMMEY
jgi:hypothetical protein